MNKLRQYITPISASVLALVVVLAPTLAFAQASDASFIQKLVWNVLVAITGSILYISGIVFDYSINSFVMGFADYYTNSGVGFAVDRTWVTIRDFVNLFFIFGLVYIGFKMILDSDDSNTRRWLVNLIIAALLINFSLFITKFVVDFSNTMSTQIAISGFGATQTGTSATGISGAWEVDITTQILDLMGITSLFNTSGDALRSASWGYIFGTAIMFLVTAFVLMAGGFLLIIRFAMLNLFMVLSPFMFIGWILPPLSNLTSKYWDAFLRRAFFAPVYFLFLYFSLEIMKAFQQSLQQTNGLQNTSNVWSSADSLSAVSTTQSTMPFFILICIFLVASIIIAQKIGADGASASIKYGQMARQKLQRGVTRSVGAGTVGVAARTGRNTIGRGSQALANNDKLKAYAARSAIGKGIFKTAQYGAGASFDARNVGGVGKKLNLGESAKGGFKKRIDDKVKAETKFAKDLGFTDTDTPEGQRKVAAKQAEIKAKKEAEKVEKEKEKKTAEEIKQHSNDSIESLNAAVEVAKELIEASKATIATKQAKFNTDDTLTVEKREELKLEIESDKKKQEEHKRNLKVAEAAKKVGEEKAKSKQQLVLSQQAEATARENGDYNGAMKAKANQEKHKASLEAIDAKLDEEIVALEDELKEIDSVLTADKDGNFKKLNNLATASVKYEKQVDYMNQVKRTQRIVGSVATLGLGTAGGGLFGGTVAGISATGFGAGGLAAGASIGGKNSELKYIIEALDKEYGKGGAKTLGKQKAKDRIKQEKEVADEIGGDDAKPAEGKAEGE
jgi:hypothetical protein